MSCNSSGENDRFTRKKLILSVSVNNGIRDFISDHKTQKREMFIYGHQPVISCG